MTPSGRFPTVSPPLGRRRSTGKIAGDQAGKSQQILYEIPLETTPTTENGERKEQAWRERPHQRLDPILGQARQETEGARRHRWEQALAESAALVDTYRAFARVPGQARQDRQQI